MELIEHYLQHTQHRCLPSGLITPKLVPPPQTPAPPPPMTFDEAKLCMFWLHA
ncbi:hypothetical protein Ancab_013206, partial [Ancistrocladus abbreviatus]